MIKTCTLDDIITLQHIATKTFADTFAAYNTPEDMAKYLQEAYALEKLSAELQTKHSHYYLFYKDEEIAGYFKLNWDTGQSEPKGNTFLEIQCLYVDIPFKNNGIGKQMIDFSIEKAKQLGKTRLWLGVWEHNTKAIAFYKHLGFTRTGEHDFWVGDDCQTDYIMEKAIN